MAGSGFVNLQVRQRCAILGETDPATIRPPKGHAGFPDPRVPWGRPSHSQLLLRFQVPAQLCLGAVTDDGQMSPDSFGVNEGVRLARVPKS